MRELASRTSGGLVARAAGALGLAGSGLAVLASPALSGGRVRWWLAPGMPAAALLFYLGVALLVLAWLWLGRQVRAGQLSARTIGWAACWWSAPFLLGPPLFSHDVYSYLAQGTLVHLGLNPYRVVPAALAGAGRASVLHAVSPFWRHTTAPYGPGFLALLGLVAGLTGPHVVAGAIIVRLLELPGLALLALCVPRLARRLGADPAQAAWLVLTNPLIVLGLVAPGHSDLLMDGMLCAGILLALQGHPLAALALCALAATVKVPALAGVGFIGVMWLRSLPDGRSRMRAALAGAAVTLGSLVAVTLASGLGPGWISSGVFSTPNRVHLAITPATAAGFTLAALLRDVGTASNGHALESMLALCSLALAAVVAATLLWRAERRGLARSLGLALLAFAVGGPAAWPWYLSWGLVLLAACPLQRALVLLMAVASVAGALVVKPNGILTLPLDSAPAVILVYAALGAGGLWAWRSRRHRPCAGAAATAAAGRPAAAAGPRELTRAR